MERWGIGYEDAVDEMPLLLGVLVFIGMALSIMVLVVRGNDRARDLREAHAALAACKSGGEKHGP